MELEKLQKFYQEAQEIEGLISNAYVISHYADATLLLQGHFNRILVGQYYDKANFVVSASGFIEGHLEIGGLQISLIFD